MLINRLMLSVQAEGKFAAKSSSKSGSSSSSSKAAAKGMEWNY
jgi:hypothetical protein